MKLEEQVTSVCRSAWFHLFQISKIRKYLTTDQTKSVIHAYVTSHIDQNNCLLIGLPKKSLKCVQYVQNASAKLIVGAKKRDHVTPILMELHWLPVEQRVLFKIILLTFKSLHGEGPTYLKDLLLPYTPKRNLRSASANMLTCPQSHYAETRKRAFTMRAPEEWNRLPMELKNCKSVNAFKGQLKTYLFRIAYF